MSHFAVLVVGEDWEQKLAPYQENNMGDCPKEYLEFEPVEEEYRKEYEEGTRKAFYCESCSSWGQEISKENYAKIEDCFIGDTIVLEINNKTFGSYFKQGKKYRCYYKEKHEAPTKEELIWVEVVDILNNGGHPDPNVCFKGRIRVRVIDPPKEVPLKEYYDDFEDFLSDWAGYEEKDPETGEYGYWRNPNAKWDWVQVGGRYRDRLKLLPGSSGEKGERQEQFVGSLYKKSKGSEWCDQARKGDIDWSAIHQVWEDYEEALRFWELKVEGQEPQNEKEEELLKYDWYKPEYYKERYKNKETYAKCRSNFTMWAIVTEDGQWVEKGEMGWFGISGEGHDEAVAWEMEFYDTFIKPLPDDVLLTVVDCHI